MTWELITSLILVALSLYTIAKRKVFFFFLNVFFRISCTQKRLNLMEVTMVGLLTLEQAHSFLDLHMHPGMRSGL